ncbi:MAG: Gfo/Idh/MocA family protein [Chloroflexota bacterium]
MSVLTVGLVGKRAGAFVAGLQTLPDVRIVGICEPSEAARARLAERAGVPEAGQFTDYDALLEAARPEVVILGTPMHLHVPQAVQALERGMHVLSEVTAAVDLDQCHALVRGVRQAARTSGAQYMMAENYCYRKDVVLVRALARKGLFGELYFAEGEYIHDVKRLHHFPDGSPTWRATWQVGKRGCTYGTHSLGPALEFFGPEARVVTVSCVGTGVHSDPEHPHDDTCLMLCQLDTGTAGRGQAGTAGQGQIGGLIKVRLDMMSNRPHTAAYYSLQGTTGCYEGARGFGDAPKIWLDGHDSGQAASPTRSAREWRSLWDYEEHLPELWRNPSEAALRAGHGGGDYFIAREFIQAIRSGQPPPIDVYRAMDYTVPGLISEQSIAAGGAPLPVPDFRQVGGDAASPAAGAGVR